MEAANFREGIANRRVELSIRANHKQETNGVETMPPPETAATKRKHWTREIIKALPLGRTLEGMTYGTKDALKKEADKEKLDAILNAASTDLDDILNRLRDQHGRTIGGEVQGEALVSTPIHRDPKEPSALG